MSIFTRIGSWFKAVFSNFGTVVQEILHGISAAVNLAVPLVTELSAIAAANPDATKLTTEVSSWLSTILKDSTAVQTWVQGTTGMSVAQILQSAATVALGELVPSVTLRSDLNLAVELAYAIFKKTAPAGTPVV